MKKIIILTTILTLNIFAQTTTSHDQSEQPLQNSDGKLITFRDIEEVINGDVVTKTTTYSRKLDNETKFFPDNICVNILKHRSICVTVVSLQRMTCLLNQELII